MSAALLLALLTACGGGGNTSQCTLANPSACGGGGTLTSGSGTGSNTALPVAAAISVRLLDGNGQPVSLLAAGASATAAASVTDANGKPLAGVLINFKSSDLLRASVSAGSAVSDLNGLASVTVQSAAPAASGAASVSATVAAPVQSAVLTASVNFALGAAAQDAPAAVTLVAISPADKSILIKGNIGIGRVQTAQITFKVSGKNGQPIANQAVRFNFVPSAADLTFASASGSTGLDGQVTAIVNSGNTPTLAAVKISVTDASGTVLISAISDQITVTNTTLNPAGITLATTVRSIEAVDVAGQSAFITAYLGDLHGAAINDGTAVTFITDGGLIVGRDTQGAPTDSAKCTSIKGSCTVTLVGANPRPPAGVATVTASVQLNGAIVSQTIRIAFSGSQAIFSGNFNIDLGSCAPQTLNFGVNDAFGNAMPENSQLLVVGASNVAAELVNASVKPIQPNGATSHQLILSPNQTCRADGTLAVSGAATLVLRTPSGIESSQQVSVHYRAQP